MADCAPILRIGLVHDHAIEREGLRALIEAQPDMQVVSEAGDGREALRLVASANPDVVITETIMPLVNGAELTGELQQQYPGVKVIALTRNEGRDCVLRLIRAGVSAYLLKTASSDELVNAVRTVCDGGRVLGPWALQAVLGDYVRRCQQDPGADGSRLSPRETEVLKLVAEGYTSQGIAEQLRLSRKTIEAHRHNIMGKLNAGNVADLVKHAVREGLVTLE